MIGRVFRVTIYSWMIKISHNLCLEKDQRKDISNLLPKLSWCVGRSIISTMNWFYFWQETWLWNFAHDHHVAPIKMTTKKLPYFAFNKEQI